MVEIGGTVRTPTTNRRTISCADGQSGPHPGPETSSDPPEDTPRRKDHNQRSPSPSRSGSFDREPPLLNPGPSLVVGGGTFDGEPLKGPVTVPPRPTSDYQEKEGSGLVSGRP